MSKDISSEVAYERERCALLAEELVGMWENSADRNREKGSYKTWFGTTGIHPRWENAAKDMEAAANGLRAVARGIREGWDSRKLEGGQ